MLLVSKGFKILILGPQSFAGIFGGGELRIFDSARPSGAEKAEPSTPIAVVRRVGNADAGLQFTQVDEFVIKPPNDEWTLFAPTSGTGVWWRLVASDDIGDDSPTAPRIDGDIGTTALPNDMTLTTATFAEGDLLPFDSFLYTLPPLAA